MKLPVERTIELEEKLHVVIRGATAVYELLDDTRYVTVRGAIAATSPQRPLNLQVMVTVYNVVDEVVGVCTHFVENELMMFPEHFGLTIICSGNHGDPARVALSLKPV